MRGVWALVGLLLAGASEDGGLVDGGAALAPSAVTYPLTRPAVDPHPERARAPDPQPPSGFGGLAWGDPAFKLAQRQGFERSNKGAEIEYFHSEDGLQTASVYKFRESKLVEVVLLLPHGPADAYETFFASEREFEARYGKPTRGPDETWLGPPSKPGMSRDFYIRTDGLKLESYWDLPNGLHVAHQMKLNDDATLSHGTVLDARSIGVPKPAEVAAPASPAPASPPKTPEQLAVELSAGHPPVDGYLNTKWGMSPAQVKKAVPGLKTIEKKGDGKLALALEGAVGGVPAMTIFAFEKNALAAAQVRFKSSTGDSKSCAGDFDHISELLNQKYGPSAPGEVETWHDELFKGDPSKRGLALVSSSLDLSETWFRSKTIIVHEAKGSGFQVEHTVSYGPMELAISGAKERNAKAKDTSGL